MYGSEQRTYVKVGAITLAAVVLLLLGITIGRGVNISTAPVQLRIRAASADGLEVGAPVWINGIKRGTVVSVRPDGDSVLIVAGIDDATMLRADAFARIAMLEITGGKRLDIVPGTSAARWNGTTLRAESYGNLTDMFGQLGGLASRAGVVIDRLDTTIRAANAVLADRTVQEQLRQTIEQSSQLVAELRQMVETNRATVERIVADVGAIGRELRDAIEHNRPTVERLLERLDRTSAELESLAQKASRLATSADTTLSQLNALLGDLRSQRTVLGKLLYDEQLASSLDTTLRRIGGLVDTISRFGVNVNVRLGTRP
ncbi:MAG: MlaD family protein [Chlorobi bacterium]|jgi:phospholipid/cholesterol/gamma-HCH transport system substrate-binding protein|nr:MlaD family protein [Chlorobiota bacterium]